MVLPGDSTSSPGAGVVERLTGRLRAELGREGLHIVLPLVAEAFNRESAAVGGPSMAALLDGARGAFVVGDGGPEFFARFRRDQTAIGVAASRDPLDDYTRRCVGRAVTDALAGGPGLRHRIVYPFEGGGPAPAARPLPFQRLGRAAGLPAAGPLGIQVHPRFGPWWAYRALVVVAGASVTVEAAPPLVSSCEGCPAPCAGACPGHAVAAAVDFAVALCASHRQVAPACFNACAARLACPVGTSQQYPEEQLAFHMTASLAQIRGYAKPSAP